MVITFDLRDIGRKQLVEAIAEITGARAVYKFMPTCAYEIDFFTVTKEGTLEFPDRSDTELVELVLDELAEKGFTMTSAVNESGQSEMFDSNENSETAETPTQPDTAATAENIDRFSISMRRDFFDEALFTKLDRLIESKSELFKMAFQTDDLSYEVTEDRVTFAWFPWAKIADEGVAYSKFIDLLMKHLKEQKRVNASKTQTDNPKFAMRVFLIRLGMVGEEYKAARKILLRNLEGSSAFRKGAPHNEETE